MSAVANSRARFRVALEWLPIAAGLLLLYVPTVYFLATTFWSGEENTQGPIILALSLWLAWRQRSALGETEFRPHPIGGGALLVFGLLLYVLGRSQDIGSVQVGSLIPVLAGVLLAMRGVRGLRAFWFPLLFLAFMVPLPAFFVDGLTGHLKQAVSASAEQILYLAGYPIARSGVMLEIGRYQLLVENACSGLNSMFSLSALGLLYLYLVRRPSWLHNGVILVSILPMAFAANVVRVVALALITYHLGDAAGQGFLHNAAGLLLVLAALVIILALDAVLAQLIRPRQPR